MYSLVPAKSVRKMVTEGHYLHRFPALPMFCFGYTEGDRVTAACIFGFPASQTFGKNTLELVRLYRDPAYTGGPLTKLLSFSFKYLKRQEKRRVDFVISFADSGAGHHGGIYQAFNGCYVGTSPGQALYLHTPTGKLVSRRNKSHAKKRHGAKTEEFVKQAKPEPKHLYVWGVQGTLEDALKTLGRERQPYPKPDPERVTGR